MIRHTTIIYFTLTFGIILSFASPAAAQYNRIYHVYLEKAQEAIQEKDYGNALLYLETAQIVRPDDPEITKYLNTVKRALEQRMVDAGVTQTPVKTEISEKKKAARKAGSVLEVKKTTEAEIPPEEIQEPAPLAVSSVKPPEKTIVSSDQSTTAGQVLTAPVQALIQSEKERKTLALDQELWALQPDTEIELALNQELVIHDTNIVRYLAVSPDVIEVSRLSNREILVTPKAYGRSFLHVWDANQRWTFVLMAILPSQTRERRLETETLRQTSVDPFRLHYDVNWNSFSTGPSLNKLDRRSLSVRNYFLLEGSTPYGYFDSSLNTYKTDTDSTEITDYSMGLRDAQWKQFRDIDIRIFDLNKPISPLTFSGRDIRGVLLEAESIYGYDLTYLRGKDQATFGAVSSGSSSRDLYFEAGTIALHPDSDKTVSLNAARAWGDDHAVNASRDVYSMEYEQAFEKWSLWSEAGYDADEYAQMLWTHYREKDHYFSVTARNVPESYELVTGPPGNQGEIGAAVSVGHNSDDIYFTHFLDLYRDRENKNPDDPDAVNIDFNSSFRKDMTSVDTLTGNMYFIHTPGLLGNRTDLRLASGYAHRFELFGRENTRLSWTGSYQRNRSESSPASDYDRLGITTAFAMPISKNFHFNASYEQYCVIDVAQNDEKNYPTAFNAGLFYNQTFAQKWNTTVSVFYRDEQNAEDLKSFLAGQDSLTIGSSLTYRPRQGLNLYVDGRVRDVWAENDRTEAVMEADIRLGLRSEWDLGYVWNPTGIVTGYVFKDTNKDGEKDDAEPGIPGVRVKVGNESAVTDQTGWYYCAVKAKKVKVSLDVDTIPDGFVFQDISAKEFLIHHNNYYKGDFSLVTESGIYGVVFVDRNENGRPDEGDQFISKVKIILDNVQTAVTDLKGGYFFYNIPDGDHVLGLDMASLPVEYLPQIPLTNKITVSEGSTYIFHIPVSPKK